MDAKVAKKWMEKMTSGGGRPCGGADRDKVVVGLPPFVSPAQASDAGRASERPDSSITDNKFKATLSLALAN
jgi:hypothetical protein